MMMSSTGKGSHTTYLPGSASYNVMDYTLLEILLKVHSSQNLITTNINMPQLIVKVILE